MSRPLLDEMFSTTIAAITSALSALLDQPHAIQAGQILFLARP